MLATNRLSHKQASRVTGWIRRSSVHTIIMAPNILRQRQQEQPALAMRSSHIHISPTRISNNWLQQLQASHFSSIHPLRVAGIINRHRF